MFGSVEAMDMFIEPGTGKVRYTFECPIEGATFVGTISAGIFLESAMVGPSKRPN